MIEMILVSKALALGELEINKGTQFFHFVSCKLL